MRVCTHTHIRMIQGFKVGCGGMGGWDGWVEEWVDGWAEGWVESEVKPKVL